MTTFKTVVRKKRADGFYPVYIRVVHRSRIGYIKTDKVVTDRQIMKSGDIKDAFVNDCRFHKGYTPVRDKKSLIKVGNLANILYLYR